jgi:hypothetical protein
MLRRVSIITICLCGLLSAPFALLRDAPQWATECSIVTQPSQGPGQNSDTESRRRSVSVYAQTQARRIPRLAHVVLAPPRTPAVPIPHCANRFSATIPPDLEHRSPRAPPSVV